MSRAISAEVLRSGTWSEVLSRQVAQEHRPPLQRPEPGAWLLLGLARTVQPPPRIAGTQHLGFTMKPYLQVWLGLQYARRARKLLDSWELKHQY